MKSLSFVRVLVATSALCLVLPLACGDSEENPDPSPSGGGEGGEPTTGRGGEPAAGGAPVVMLPPGISDMPKTELCNESCDSAQVGVGTASYYLDPCCTDADNACGLNTAFLASVGAMFEETCQAKNQPGGEDPACPAPPQAMIPIMGQMATLNEFPGCCRPGGVCGVLVNAVGIGPLPLGDLELGCVDAAPFFPDEDPVPCGDMEPVGGAGGGGAGGASGGAPTVVGGSDGLGGAGGNN